MSKELKNYIKSLSSDKKQRIYTLRRELRNKDYHYLRLNKGNSCFNITDFNGEIILQIPFYNGSVFKGYFISNMILDALSTFLSDTFKADYFFDDKRFSNKKVLFNKGFSLDDTDFIAGCFPY